MSWKVYFQNAMVPLILYILVPSYNRVFFSGSSANFAVYISLLEPRGRIMGLDPCDGGHHSHGFIMGKEKLSATSIFFDSRSYKVVYLAYITHWFVRSDYPDVCGSGRSWIFYKGWRRDGRVAWVGSVQGYISHACIDSWLMFFYTIINKSKLVFYLKMV